MRVLVLAAGLTLLGIALPTSSTAKTRSRVLNPLASDPVVRGVGKVTRKMIGSVFGTIGALKTRHGYNRKVLDTDQHMTLAEARTYRQTGKLPGRLSPKKILQTKANRVIKGLSNLVEQESVLRKELAVAESARSPTLKGYKLPNQWKITAAASDAVKKSRRVTENELRGVISYAKEHKLQTDAILAVGSHMKEIGGLTLLKQALSQPEQRRILPRRLPRELPHRLLNMLVP